MAVRYLIAVYDKKEGNFRAYGSTANISSITPGDYDGIQKFLKNLGVDDWELVSVVHDSERDLEVFYFKGI